MFDGLYLSITCAEDVPPSAPAPPTRRADVSRRLPRAASSGRMRGVAARRRTRRPATPRTAAVPVLILSGTLDPVTPPANGDVLARTLAGRLHVRVPSGGHALAV